MLIHLFFLLFPIQARVDNVLLESDRFDSGFFLGSDGEAFKLGVSRLQISEIFTISGLINELTAVYTRLVK